ncbi:MAG: hypothetical protein CVU24_10955 [Betaproteobacteria bacterium HGW-Betaproteobacteria-18]|nr:MAG: hypothetical protein CVU24_10955 [Betaproteobacteria bacterium HGW-Betaproteobacteria-18]
MHMNKPTEMANALVDQASHAADQVARSTQQLAHGVMEGVLDTSHQLPVKAMLIAAATGAALMALVSLFSRSRSHR